jgi:hypothetical protein
MAHRFEEINPTFLYIRAPTDCPMPFSRRRVGIAFVEEKSPNSSRLNYTLSLTKEQTE